MAKRKAVKLELFVGGPFHPLRAGLLERAGSFRRSGIRFSAAAFDDETIKLTGQNTRYWLEHLRRSDVAIYVLAATHAQARRRRFGHYTREEAAQSSRAGQVSCILVGMDHNCRFVRGVRRAFHPTRDVGFQPITPIDASTGVANSQLVTRKFAGALRSTASHWTEWIDFAQRQAETIEHSVREVSRESDLEKLRRKSMDERGEPRAEAIRRYIACAWLLRQAHELRSDLARHLWQAYLMVRYPRRSPSTVRSGASATTRTLWRRLERIAVRGDLERAFPMMADWQQAAAIHLLREVAVALRYDRRFRSDWATARLALKLYDMRASHIDPHEKLFYELAVAVIHSAALAGAVPELHRTDPHGRAIRVLETHLRNGSPGAALTLGIYDAARSKHVAAHVKIEKAYLGERDVVPKIHVLITLACAVRGASRLSAFERLDALEATWPALCHAPYAVMASYAKFHPEAKWREIVNAVGRACSV